MEITKNCQKLGWNKTLLLILVVVVFSGYVSAFGVGSLYSDNNPLKLSVGESKEIIFNFQNPQGDDINFRPSIKEGNEIISLINSGDVFLPVGDSIDVKAIVIVPGDARVGDVYPIELAFTTISGVKGGTLGLGSSVGRKFDLIIVPTEKELVLAKENEESKGLFNNMIFSLFIAILIIVIIALLMVRNKKNKHNNIRKRKKR